MSVAAASHFFAAVSHTPHKRAERETEDLSARLDTIRSRALELSTMPGARPLPVGLLADLVARHERVTCAFWQSVGRTASSVIVGPARFPVERMAKRRAVADRRYEAIRDDLGRALAAMEQAAFPFGLPGAAIRGNDPEAVAKLKARLREVEGERERNKRCAALVRKGDWVGVARIAGVKAAASAKSLSESGLRPFSADNLGAEARRLGARIAELEARKEAGTVEGEAIEGVRLVENPEADRVQLFFSQRPCAEEKAILKAHGFRFAPSQGDAWQRHLNNRGRYMAQQALKALAAL